VLCTVINSARNEQNKVETEIKNYICNIVLYGCETRFVTLTAEHRLRICMNRVLRKAFGSKGEEVTG
jgi:uncharacterized lipoprotein YajG